MFIIVFGLFAMLVMGTIYHYCPRQRFPAGFLFLIYGIGTVVLITSLILGKIQL